MRRCLALAVLFACGLLLIAAAPAAAEDITPPTVTAFSLLPKHVDTTSASQTLTVDLTVKDSQSGVASVNVQLRSKLSQQWVQADAVRLTGDASDGTYQAELVLPRGSMSGEWDAIVATFDVIGNLSALFWWQLDQSFGVESGEITNDATVCDSTAPHATAITVSPKQVDTAAGDQTVTVSVSVDDDLSGVQGMTAWLHSGRTEQSHWVPLTRVSGDVMSGEYSGSTTLPRYSASGEWSLFFSGQDQCGNVAASEDLGAALGVEGTVTNDAAVDDVAPPQLIGLSITPPVFDTESGEQQLTATVRATDDLAGVSTLLVYVEPMLSVQMHYVELDRTSGNGLDTTLAGTITLPQGAEVGPWRTRVEAYDVLGNHVWYQPDQLAALLPDATGITLVNTAQAQQVTVRKEWVLTGEGCTVTFPAGTVVTRSEGGAFAFYRMVAQPFAFTADVPTEDLNGTPVATLRFGIPGLDLSFSQPVAVRMEVGHEYDGYLVRIESLKEGDEAWANETESLVADGLVGFTVNHATRFVAAPAKAQVTKVTPRACRRGARVTILGRGFGAARGRSSVLLGGKICRTCTRWTPRAVTFVVPRGAALGRLRLAVRVHGATTRAGVLTVRR